MNMTPEEVAAVIATQTVEAFRWMNRAVRVEQELAKVRDEHDKLKAELEKLTAQEVEPEKGE